MPHTAGISWVPSTEAAGHLVRKAVKAAALALIDVDTDESRGAALVVSARTIASMIQTGDDRASLSVAATLLAEAVARHGQDVADGKPVTA